MVPIDEKGLPGDLGDQEWESGIGPDEVGGIDTSDASTFSASTGAPMHPCGETGGGNPANRDRNL